MRQSINRTREAEAVHNSVSLKTQRDPIYDYNMNRGVKLVDMCINKRDCDTLQRLELPKYETTAGLDREMANFLLTQQNSLLDDRHFSASPIMPVQDIQIQNISSTEKTVKTRNMQKIETAKKILFKKSFSKFPNNEKTEAIVLLNAETMYENGADSEAKLKNNNMEVAYKCIGDEEENGGSDRSNSESEAFYQNNVESTSMDQHSTENVSQITSTFDEENDVYEDSGSEYVPESETDSESDISVSGPASDGFDHVIEVQPKIIIHENKIIKQATKEIISPNITCRPKCNFKNNEDKENQKVTSAEELEYKEKGRKRLWNKKDLCIFCDTEVMKFSRHVLRHHQSEIEVQEILALKTGDRKRKFLFNKLRNQGNFVKSVSGESVVAIRKPTKSDAISETSASYLPCKYCKGFYKKKYLYRHIKVCPHNTDLKKGKCMAQSEGQSLFSAYKENDMLREKVFPIMKPDEKSFVAKTDILICAVARRYLKSHREKQFLTVSSRKMRQLASLLIEIRKLTGLRSLLSALDPQYFDIIIKSTKTMCRYDPSTETYGAPSLALHMGTELKDCIDVAYAMNLRKLNGETEVTKKLKSLKELINSEWRYEISTIANSDLQRKKWNRPSLIPLAEDLTLLKSYLLSESRQIQTKLHSDPKDERAFKALQEITYVQLILLNRRRIGELQRMTLKEYTSNIDNKLSSEFDSCISESEKILLNSFKRIVIRGKRGRGVPVLFTAEMIKSTDLLLELRQNFIKEPNLYLFANTTTSSAINGYKAIYKHVRCAGVKNPQALTSTKLRKHLATMSQVINLSPQDLEQLATFMGHTTDIHKSYYRLPNDVYQLAKISKLLLLNERGAAAKYKGKSLDEVDIELEVEEDSSDESDREQPDFEKAMENEVKKEIEVARRSKDRSESSADKATTSTTTSKVLTVAPPKKKRVLEPWSKQQKAVALEYFKKHIKQRIAPKKDETVKLINDNPTLFANKDWVKIKIFVVNTYNKNK